MTAETTTASYWVNWRVLLCGTWVLMSIVFSSFLITKYEGGGSSHGRRRVAEEKEDNDGGVVYGDEVWRPCLKGVHPGWLLGFRVVAFFVLLILLIFNVVVDGATILYFYTQWTFTLVTVYFGLGTLLSMYGCYQFQSEDGGGDRMVNTSDAEQGNYGSPFHHQNSNNALNLAKAFGPTHQEDTTVPQSAGLWGYVFQIIFQMNAGAVILTDCVFWFIIFPFLAIKDYSINFWIINMHSINMVFLLGDTALNSLRFPWFRIAYFLLWTSVFVLFQWILHACVSLWWPYPFLDLSSPLAPLWYSSVALMHIPCYGIFALVMKLKHFLLSKWFPESYMCRR